MARTSALIGTAALAIGTIAVTTSDAAAPAHAHAPDDGVVFINELHYDNEGTDEGEAIEVAGPAGTDLSGWSLVLYNGNNNESYDTSELDGAIPDEGGRFGAVSVSYPVNGVQNGSPDGIALVDCAGEVAQFLSYEGTFDAADGPAAGMTSTDIGVSEGPSTPIGGSLVLTGTGTSYGDFTWDTGTAGFGELNDAQELTGSPEPPNPDCETPPEGNCAAPPDVTPIHEVQGDGADTPCAGEQVTVEGVVVGDHEGPSPTLRGFYVQQTDDTRDDDPLTSEAVFVFNFDRDTVQLGDLVQVTGEAGEFQGQTQINVNADPSSNEPEIDVVESAVAVTPTDVPMPADSDEYFERYEGMLVRFPDELTVTEFFQLGRFGQVVASSGGKLDQPTNVVAPGDEANALQAENDLRRIVIDDALNNQNPDPIVLGRGGEPLSADNTLRGGDTVTGATGVLTYTWAGNSASGNAYRLRIQNYQSPDDPVAAGPVPDFQPANPRPTAPPEAGGSLRVTNFNVLNYFLTIDEGDNQCGPEGFEQGCRGADSPEELERQRAKLLTALDKIDADIVGMVELENTTGVEPLADIVAGLNELNGEGTYDYVETGTIGTDVIKVGVIYKPGAVTPAGEPAILDSSVDERFDDDRNRPALAVTFEDNATGGHVTTVLNHLKSKGSCPSDGGPDDDLGDGQACWNATRTAAAEALVDWVGGNLTGIKTDNVLIGGDLNSYAMEDPIQVLHDAGYVDLGETHGDGYSYVFDGQWGTLDYSFASTALFEHVTGAGEYHVNADEPNALDYNTDFKSPSQIDDLYAPDEFRTSDHDPMVAGIELEGQEQTLGECIREALDNDDWEAFAQCMRDHLPHWPERDRGGPWRGG